MEIRGTISFERPCFAYLATFIKNKKSMHEKRNVHQLSIYMFVSQVTVSEFTSALFLQILHCLHSSFALILLFLNMF